MKKLSFVLAAAGLMTLAACGSNETPAENAVEAKAAAIENTADSLEAAADNATNESTEAALENTADNLHDAASNVGENKM